MNDDIGSTYLEVLPGARSPGYRLQIVQPPTKVSMLSLDMTYAERWLTENGISRPRYLRDDTLHFTYLVI